MFFSKISKFWNGIRAIFTILWTSCRKNTTLWGTSIEQLILDALADYDFPIAFNMPAGHEDDNRALILGRKATLKVEKTKSTLVFE